MEQWYDREEDIFNIQLKPGTYWKSIELPSGVVIDVAKDGSIIAIEIQRASQVFSGDVRNVIQAVPEASA
ncbi:MAG TPA: DUF2283 domain-containing protein [Candidatus Paceibacterota bacterium]